MAKFQYRCGDCGRERELQHPIGQEILHPCVNCAGVMRIKPQFTPTLYSGSPAFYGAMKTYPKCGPR